MNENASTLRLALSTSPAILNLVLWFDLLFLFLVLQLTNRSSVAGIKVEGRNGGKEERRKGRKVEKVIF